MWPASDELKQMDELGHHTDWEDISAHHIKVASHITTQEEGAREFETFKSQVRKMDVELLNLTRVAPRLGGSVRILVSAGSLREFLPRLLHICRENAVHLFPRSVQRPSENIRRGHLRRHSDLLPPDEVELATGRYRTAEDMPALLEVLAKEFTIFMECLLDFKALTEDGGDAFESFITDLTYWSACLTNYEGRFHEDAFQRYIHRLTVQMEDDLTSITVALKYVVEIAMPANIIEHERTTSVMLQLSSVAVFLSAVTATTIQFSYSQSQTWPFVLVNIAWFTSLALSTISAVISLIGVSWMMSKYRSSGKKMPNWLLIGIMHSPILFLDVAIFTFLVGLFVFPYASKQHLATSTITSVSIALGAIVIIALANWFLFEWLTYLHYHGHKAPMDLILETMRLFIPSLSTIAQIKAFFKRERRSSLPTSHQNPSAYKFPPNATDVQEKAISPAPEKPQVVQFAPRPRLLAQESTRRKSTRTIEQLVINLHGNMLPDPSGSPHTPSISVMRPLSNFMPMPQPETEKTDKAASYTLDWITPKEWAEQNELSLAGSASSDHPTHWRSLKLLRKEYQLRTLDSVKHLHLDFSPDGSYLAASRWNEPTVIFKVDTELKEIKRLSQHRGLLGLVVWSPVGHRLLTSSNRAIKIWTVNGDLIVDIQRHKHVESTEWLPDGNSFISVEGSEVVQMDLNGKVRKTYKFEHMQLYGAVVTPDGHRLICVGTLVGKGEVQQRHWSRLEKRITVCDLRNNEIEDQVPLWDDARYIAMSRNGKAVLIGYKHGVSPQLWTLSDVPPLPSPAAAVATATGPDRQETDGALKRRRQPISCLTLAQTYVDEAVTKKGFSKRCYFGGPQDQFVVCTTRAGGLSAWDTKTGQLLHHISAHDTDGDVTCMAWNDASEENVMLATGNSRGSITIWKTAHIGTPMPSPEPVAAPFKPGPPGPPSAITLSTSYQQQRSHPVTASSSMAPSATSGL